MFVSVVIPTYNRRPILIKCLAALERQIVDAGLVEGYEVVLVDDGSTDDTWSTIALHAAALPHLRLFRQPHSGPAAARNLGIRHCRGDVIVFIDSDLVVAGGFIAAHARSLIAARQRYGHTRFFTYGKVIDTHDFQTPERTAASMADWSAAYFATGNVAIFKQWLDKVGGFDTDFREYGWEDLEMGERLKKLRLTLIRCPSAVGYHWHPPFSLDQMPVLIDREIQRSRSGLIFLKKHPSLRVRCMIQKTWVHRWLWEGLTLGGLLNERSLAPLIKRLIQGGYHRTAFKIATIPLNLHGVRALYRPKALHPRR